MEIVLRKLKIKISENHLVVSKMEMEQTNNCNLPQIIRTLILLFLFTETFTFLVAIVFLTLLVRNVFGTKATQTCSARKSNIIPNCRHVLH